MKWNLAEENDYQIFVCTNQSVTKKKFGLQKETHVRLYLFEKIKPY